MDRETGHFHGTAVVTMTANKADRKANIAAGRASARQHPEPMLVEELPDVPGFQFWKVGDVLVGMPALLPHAPASVRRRYRLRIVSNAVGECMRCEAVVADPLEGHRASLAHENGCPLLLHDIERWVDPRASAMRGALAGERGVA
jgi:hypothetical protein